MEAYGSVTRNGQNPEATKRSFSWWLDKEAVVRPDDGMLFSAEKKRAMKGQEGTWRAHAYEARPQRLHTV